MPDACPKCGGAMRLEEKDTSSGTDWREYRCAACGHVETENRGKALWELLHEANEERRAAAAAPAPRGWLERIRALFRR